MLTVPTLPKAVCTDNDGSFTCACDVGFSGDGFNCTDDDECINPGDNDCHADAACNNTFGSFECFCNDGYSGNGTFCEDVDECLTSPCDQYANCTNTIGNYTCECLDGFTGDGWSCVDDDECVLGTDNCAPIEENSLCVNTIGSFNCTCRPGYDSYDDNGTSRCRNLACDGVSCVDNESCFSWWNPTDLTTEAACYCDNGYVKTDAGFCMQSTFAENVFMANISMGTDLSILDDQTAESFFLSMNYVAIKDDMYIFAIIPADAPQGEYDCDILCDNGFCALNEDSNRDFTPSCHCDSGFFLNEEGNGCVSSSPTISRSLLQPTFSRSATYNFVVLVGYDMSINETLFTTADSNGHELYQRDDAQFQQWIQDYKLHMVVPNILDVPCPNNEVYDECATDCFDSCQAQYEMDSSLGDR